MVTNSGFNYLSADLLTCVDAGIELLVSSESFQEMNLESIHAYLHLMRSQSQRNFLYSANRVSKSLPDGRIICSQDYGLSKSDVLISKSSPWWLNFGIRRKPLYLFKMEGQIEELLVELSKGVAN